MDIQKTFGEEFGPSPEGEWVKRKTKDAVFLVKPISDETIKETIELEKSYQRLKRQFIWDSIVRRMAINIIGTFRWILGIGEGEQP